MLIVLSFSGTATFGTQYVTSSESIFIPAGQTTGSITLSGNNVAIAADDLSVVVGIQANYGANQASLQTATATLTPGNVASASITGQVTGNGGGLSGIIVYLTSATVSALRDRGRLQSLGEHFHHDRRQRQLLRSPDFRQDSTRSAN